MKAAIVLAAAGLVAAQMPDISQVPPCVLTCLLPAVSQAGCGPADVSCACGKMTEVQAFAKPCVEKSCQPEDQKKALSLAGSLCKNSGSSTADSSTATGSKTTAESQTMSTGSTTMESTPVVTESTTMPSVSSGMSTALPTNGTGMPTPVMPTGTGVPPGTNGAAIPAAGAFAALAAAVFAL